MLHMMPGCTEKEENEEGQEVSPPDDLMPEHCEKNLKRTNTSYLVKMVLIQW